MKTGNKIINRKDFLRKSGGVICAFALGSAILNSCKENFLFPSSEEDYYIKPARHWVPQEGGMVQCRLCPNECTLGRGDRGICRSRKNIDGKLFSLVYSRLAAVHVDPIEKKPLFHFLPGSTAFSVATAGCNLSCKFCQNWQISQSKPEDLNAERINPDEISKKAGNSGARVIAYTYNEPTIQFEYIMDSAAISKKRGIKSVMISNGYTQEKPSRELAGLLDGIKNDLKSFSENFYQKICGGELKNVLKNLETVYSSGKWLEIVNLVIPTLNDSPSEIRNMTRCIKKNL